jgi:hypothetical protein
LRRVYTNGLGNLNLVLPVKCYSNFTWNWNGMIFFYQKRLIVQKYWSKDKPQTSLRYPSFSRKALPCSTKHHAMKTYGEWRYSSKHSKPSRKMGANCQIHAPVTVPPGERPQYPLERTLVVPQSRSGHGGEERESLPLSGIEPRSASP